MKTAAEILTEQHQKEVEIADKIDRACVTMNQDAELRIFIGEACHMAPFIRALKAAALILSGKQPLPWMPV